jgi:hypothetical protein
VVFGYVCVLFFHINNSKLSAMECMNVNLDGSLSVYPFIPTQDQMVSVILIASRVRPSSALVED